MEDAPGLVKTNGHLVHSETGELVASCPRCAILEDQLAGAETENRGWRLRYANLARDKERDARKHPLWAEAMGLFDYWKQRCHHPKARFNAARFALVLPFIEKDGPELCRRAIRGAAFDPFITRRRNGTTQRHDDWDLIFRAGRKQFEDFANKAPLEAEPTDLKRLADRVLAEMPEDDRPTADRITEAVGRAEAILRKTD